MTLGVEVGLGPGHIVLDGEPALLPKKGGRVPNFRRIFIVAKRMEVGLGPGQIVLDGDPALLPKKGRCPQFSAHIYCGQAAAWTKMPPGPEYRPRCSC